MSKNKTKFEVSISKSVTVQIWGDLPIYGIWILPGHLLLPSSPVLPFPKVPRLRLLHQGDLAGRPAQETDPASDDGKDTLAAPWTPGYDTCAARLHWPWWGRRSWRPGLSWYCLWIGCRMIQWWRYNDKPWSWQGKHADWLQKMTALLLKLEPLVVTERWEAHKVNMWKWMDLKLTTMP